jgi:mRNA interferase HicA
MMRVLEKLGFSLKRQHGSHAFYYRPDGRRTVVPIHSRDLSRVTVHRILKDIGLSEDELRQCL